MWEPAMVASSADWLAASMAGRSVGASAVGMVAMMAHRSVVTTAAVRAVSMAETLADVSAGMWDD
jgi:hypothetical protein